MGAPCSPSVAASGVVSGTCQALLPACRPRHHSCVSTYTAARGETPGACRLTAATLQHQPSAWGVPQSRPCLRAPRQRLSATLAAEPSTSSPAESARDHGARPQTREPPDLDSLRLPQYDPSSTERLNLIVAGGGPAGLAVAERVSAAGHKVLPCDCRDGQLRSFPPSARRGRSSGDSTGYKGIVSVLELQSM